MEPQSNLMLEKIRREFGFFGGISLIFGITAVLLFYKAGIGLNSFVFTIIITILIALIAKRLNITMKKEVAFSLSASMLLSLSNVLTSSFDLRFLNNIGILLLLDYSLIRLFDDGKLMDFTDDLLNLIALPFKALTSVGMLFIDGNNFVKNKKIIRSDRIRNILIGCIIAVPLLIINISLLSRADLLFGKITGSMFKLLFGSDIIVIVILAVLGTLCCYSLICRSAREKIAAGQKITKASPTIGITVSAILLLTYVIFCGIQILYLFAGGIFVLPEEFTYSEYARRGFFELLAVTCFNIILILISAKVFEQNRHLRAILTAITACTYIMIASAAYRMLLYIGAYHLTFLRLLVLLFLLIDTLLLAGVIISLYNKSFPLFGYCVTVITICYVIFSLGRPDYHIAKYFVDHTDKIESEDLHYLTSYLSLDAASVVLPLLDRQYDYNIQLYIDHYYSRLSNSGSGDVREYNYSYSKAVKLMKNRSNTGH